MKRIANQYKMLKPGNTFHRWTVEQYEGGGRYLCRCECGTTRKVWGGNLRRGVSKSCGCYNSEVTASRNWKHGLADTPIHNLWMAMIRRCENPTNEDYDRYGGRGIKVCARWHDFLNFLKDVGPRPSPKHSLDRIDNDGNYEPGNCRWATNRQQCRNTRVNLMLTFKGRTLCAVSWAEEVNKPVSVVYGRLKRGWSVADALTRPLRVTRKRAHGSGGAILWRMKA